MKNERLKEIEKMQKRLAPSSGVKLKIIFFRIFSVFIYYFSAVTGRVIEVLIAGFISLMLTLPLFLILLLRKIVFGKDLFIAKDIFVKNGEKLCIRYFNMEYYFLRNISLFPYVIFNLLSLVGISFQAYESKSSVAEDSYLRNNRPGIFNLWYLRSSSRLTHEGRMQIEFEYLSKKNLLFDLILMLKSIPAAFYYVNDDKISDEVDLLGLKFNNLKMGEALTLLKNSIKSKRKTQVSFVNPDCFNKIFSDKEYYRVLQSSDLLFPDGIGVNIACKILDTPLKENINGTDMLPFLCEMAVENNYSIFLLGGKPGIPEDMKTNLLKKFPQLNIAGLNNGYFDKEREGEYIIDKINGSRADILLVAFGAPLQEKWILKNKELLNCNILMGVGGLFDFFSGNIPRAPKWMREIGLEWVFRLMQEPKRMWKRYIIGNPLFIFRVLRWKSRQF
jgi:N-acetylglucosaminyldiphosphoundecaprenol N-acetyl-beta-D-mannosaminyltransferase